MVYAGNDGGGGGGGGGSVMTTIWNTLLTSRLVSELQTTSPGEGDYNAICLYLKTWKRPKP